MLRYLAANWDERYWAIVFRFASIPFFKYRTHYSLLTVRRLLSRDYWILLFRVGAMTSEHDLRSVVGIPSEPLAFLLFSFLRRPHTQGGAMVIMCMAGKGKGSSTCWEQGTWLIKTEGNCEVNISALSVGSTPVLQFAVRVPTLLEFPFMLLINLHIPSTPSSCRMLMR